MDETTTIETTAEHEDRFAMVVAGLEPESATTLRQAFVPLLDKADEWMARAKAIKVTDESQKREMKLARESRLALREIRVEAEHARKRLKADALSRGRAVDGMANTIKGLLEPIEAHLLEQETFGERAQAARRDALRDARSETLRALGADPTAYADLGAMHEEVWTATLGQARDAKAARDEAARQEEAVRVEAERIAAENRAAEQAARVKAEAERVERERQAAEENARLRREAEERERAAAAERAAVEAERRVERAAAKAEADRRDEVARVAKAEAARVAAELAARERAEGERIEQERVAEQARAAAAEAAAAAPDGQKLVAFAVLLRDLDIPECSSRRGQALTAKLRTRLDTMAEQVAKAAESMQQTKPAETAAA